MMMMSNKEFFFIIGKHDELGLSVPKTQHIVPDEEFIKESKSFCFLRNDFHARPAGLSTFSSFHHSITHLLCQFQR